MFVFCREMRSSLVIFLVDYLKQYFTVLQFYFSCWSSIQPSRFVHPSKLYPKLRMLSNLLSHLSWTDKVCQWLAAGWRFSRGTLVSSTNKTEFHDITEILLKVSLNAINPPISHVILVSINIKTKPNVAIKNGQSRDIGNIVHRKKTKKKKKHRKT